MLGCRFSKGSFSLFGNCNAIAYSQPYLSESERAFPIFPLFPDFGKYVAVKGTLCPSPLDPSGYATAAMVQEYHV